MKTLSSFKGMRVVTEDGVMLGHLADLRINAADSHRHPTASAQVGALVYGTMGWLTHLGIRTIEEQTVEWRDVIRIQDDRLIVRMRDARKSTSRPRGARGSRKKKGRRR